MSLRFGLALALSVGCGAEPKAPPTGGPDAGAPDGGGGPPVPVSPEPPAPPRLEPCPAGWQRAPDADSPSIVTCDPWASGSAEACAADEGFFPGEGCVRVGTACPAGDFAEDLPKAGRVIYVLAGAAAGGDGTLAAPFARISNAVNASRPGDVIALSKGTFDEAVSLRQEVTLWGACPAETILAPTTASDVAAVEMVGAGASTLRNLQVGGVRTPIYVSATPGPAAITSVIVAGGTTVGLGVSNAGILVASDLVVRDVAPRDDGRVGYGIQVDDAAQMTLERASIERVHTIGMLVADPGTHVTATDLVVRDVLPRADDDSSGPAISLALGAIVEGERVAIARARGIGLDVIGDDTRLALSDLAIDEMLPQASDGRGGFAIQASLGGDVRVDRATLSRATVAAVLAYDVGSAVALTDVVVRDVLEYGRTGEFGYALDVHGGARATLERVDVARARTVAISASGADTILDATDVSLSALRTQASDAAGGYALQSHGGATVNLSRFRARDCVTVGLFLGDGVVFEASDLAIEDMRSSEIEGRYGGAIQASDGAHAHVVRAAFVNDRMNAVLAFHDATDVAFEDLLVRETWSAECAAAGCDDAGGVGLSTSAAHVSATRFLVTESELCGIQVADGGSMDLSGGVVSASPIGVNVSAAGFDVERLQAGVEYRDNGVNLDSSVLYVPAPLVALGDVP